MPSYSDQTWLTKTGNVRRKGATANRRVVVFVVPPVDECDLVCPFQVVGAANRLADKPVYRVEVVTNGKDLKVQGEGGVLSFYTSAGILAGIDLALAWVEEDCGGRQSHRKPRVNSSCFCAESGDRNN